MLLFDCVKRETDSQFDALPLFVIFIVLFVHFYLSQPQKYTKASHSAQKTKTKFTFFRSSYSI